MIGPLLAARDAFTRGLVSDGPADARLEVPTTSGVPDVMFIDWDEDVLADRTHRALAPVWSLTQLRALTLLNAGPAGPGELSAATGVSAGYLRGTVLPALASLGWTRDAPGGQVQLAPGLVYRAPARALVSVEAKLSNWRQAFTQAVRHIPSADRSFIALDAAKARPVLGYADDLAAAGVGVATVDAADGQVRIVSAPPAGRPHRPQFFLAAEQAWHLRRLGHASGPVGHVFGRDLPPAPEAGLPRGGWR